LQSSTYQYFQNILPKEEPAIVKVHEPLVQAHGWTLMHDFSSLSVKMKNFHEDVAEFNDGIAEMTAVATT
jgi:hypothetical protein